MIKLVNCPACKKEYNIDLTKYGGKKIKCKQCQGVVSIPTVEQASDEFEVIEESDSATANQVSPKQRVPTNSPASILQRNRLSSQRGAVNIALLQRNESSREEIREAFLEIHGSEASRLPDSIFAVSNADSELDKSIENLPDEELLDWMHDVLSRALVFDPKAVRPYLTKSSGSLLLSSGLLGMYKSFLVGPTKDVNKGITDEDAFPAAVKILGCPVRPMPVKIEKDYGFDWEGQRLKDDEARDLLIREIKIDTIKAAIEVAKNTKTILLAEKAELQKQADNLLSANARECSAVLGRAREQLHEGELDDATLALQDLLKTAPVKLLGQVLIALSQCTYLSGNISNAARHIQDAICFGGSAPVGMDDSFNDLWAKASSGLPKT